MDKQAIEKIDKELKEFKGDKYGQVIKTAVAEKLMDFARQDAEFAQAIVQSDKTLTDCCTAITKGVTTGISDIEAYRRAVAFYFPGADIRFSMTIDLCPDASDGKCTDKETSDSLVLNLSDFF